MRVYAGDLAVLDKRGDDRPVVAAFIGNGEQGVLAIEGQRPVDTLDCVAVEIDTAIVEEARVAFPASKRVADLFAELGFGADPAGPRIEILAQIIEDDAAAFIAD